MTEKAFRSKEKDDIEQNRPEKKGLHEISSPSCRSWEKELSQKCLRKNKAEGGAPFFTNSLRFEEKKKLQMFGGE